MAMTSPSCVSTGAVPIVQPFQWKFGIGRSWTARRSAGSGRRPGRVGAHVGVDLRVIYPGVTELGASPAQRLTLEEVLVKHPKLRLYVMHAGFPMLDDMLAVLYAHPQVHVDTGVIVFTQPRRCSIVTSGDRRGRIRVPRSTCHERANGRRVRQMARSRRDSRFP